MGENRHGNLTVHAAETERGDKSQEDNPLLLIEKSSGLNVGPGERVFIEYLVHQSSSRADDRLTRPTRALTPETSKPVVEFGVAGGANVVPVGE